MGRNKAGYTLSPPLALEANERLLRMSAFHEEGVVFLNRMPKDKELSYKWADSVPVVVLGEIKSTHQWERFNGYGTTKGGAVYCIQVDLLEIVFGHIFLVHNADGVLVPRSRRRKLIMGHGSFNKFKHELHSDEGILMQVAIPPLRLLRNPHHAQFGRVRISGPVGEGTNGA